MSENQSIEMDIFNHSRIKNEAIEELEKVIIHKQNEFKFKLMNDLLLEVVCIIQTEIKKPAFHA